MRRRQRQRRRGAPGRCVGLLARGQAHHGRHWRSGRLGDQGSERRGEGGGREQWRCPRRRRRQGLPLHEWCRSLPPHLQCLRRGARGGARARAGDHRRRPLGWSRVGVPFRFARCGGGRRATPDPGARCGRLRAGRRGGARARGAVRRLPAVLGSAQFERLLAAVHAHSWQLDAPEHDDGDEGGGGGGSPAPSRAWPDVPAARRRRRGIQLRARARPRQRPLRATPTALRDIAPGEGLTIGVSADAGRAQNFVISRELASSVAEGRSPCARPIQAGLEYDESASSPHLV